MNKATVNKADDTTKEPVKAEVKSEVKPDDTPNVASDCVVKSDFHVGRAVNGKVCSYHAMHYDADGNRR